MEKRQNQIIEDILNKVPDKYEDLIKEAISFVKRIHKDRKRKNGEDWIIHSLNVALSCAEMRTDTNTIIAAFLHDFSNFDTENETSHKKYIFDTFTMPVH